MANPVLENYGPGAFWCEMSDGSATQPVRDRLAALPLDELKRRAAHANAEPRDLGITFTVYSERDLADRVLPFDCIPRVLSARWPRHGRGSPRHLRGAGRRARGGGEPAGAARARPPRRWPENCVAAPQPTPETTPMLIRAGYEITYDCTQPTLMGSRYCDTDRLSDTAWSLFGNAPRGRGRVQAICDYVHDRITFGYEHARSTRTAWDGFMDARACAATSPTSPSRSAAA